MYHLSANAKTGYKNRGDIICEIVLDSKQTIPYSRIQLLGDERVLGPYIITARRFIPRLALACFPSSEADRPYDIVTGAFCDWLKPNEPELRELINRLSPRTTSEARTVREDSYRMKLDLSNPAHQRTTIGREVAVLCGLQGIPSAIFTLESVADDCPEKRRPELARLYYPKLMAPEAALYGLQMALEHTGEQ